MEELIVGAIVIASTTLLALRGYRKLTSRRPTAEAVNGACGASCGECAASCTPERSSKTALLRGTTSALVLLLLGFAPEARALDTVETWDVGATDLELYVGYDGLGLNRADRQLASSLVAGFGIIDRLSAYLAASLSSDELFSEGAGELGLGLFGTGLETDHVDIDIFLHFSLGGDGLKELQVAPAFELNLDLAPDLGTWGIYLLVALPIYGRPVDAAQVEAGSEIATHIETTVGTYLSLGGRHQILVDYEMAFHLMARGGEASVEVGSLGFGYNVLLNEAVELIAEVRIDLPDAGETASVGFVVGFIATLPSGRGDESG